jgi:hypothetical protein
MIQRGDYYTTDGDEPSLESKKYTEPVQSAENTPLRAVAYVSGKRLSEITTANYLFEDRYRAVICINGNPTAFRKSYALMNKFNKIERPQIFRFTRRMERLAFRFPRNQAKGAGTIIYSQKSLSINLRGIRAERSDLPILAGVRI